MLYLTLAFNEKQQSYIRQTRRLAQGEYPGYTDTSTSSGHNYRVKPYNYGSGRTQMYVDDYVSLASMNTYRIASKYTDFALANGFVVNFEKADVPSTNVRKRVSGTGYGYLWYHYSDSELGGEQRKIMTKDGIPAIHNLRDTIKVDFSGNNDNSTVVNWGTSSSDFPQGKNGVELKYMVSSMDQSYGVAPVIRVDSDYFLNTYLNSNTDETTTGTETNIVHNTTGTNRSFSVSTFQDSYFQYLDANFNSVTKTTNGYAVNGVVNCKTAGNEDAIKDNDYVKLVVSPTKLSDTAKSHVVNESTKYIYLKLSDLVPHTDTATGKIASYSFSVKFTTTAAVENFYVYAFYCTGDLNKVWAIEDTYETGKIATARYDTINYIFCWSKAIIC